MPVRANILLSAYTGVICAVRHLKIKSAALYMNLCFLFIIFDVCIYHKKEIWSRRIIKVLCKEDIQSEPLYDAPTYDYTNGDFYS